MQYYSNHCRCSKSNWNNEGYNSRHVVTIEEYPEVLNLDFINDEPCNDYKALVSNETVFLEDEYKKSLERLKKEPTKSEKVAIKMMFTKEVPYLNENVIKWLKENIKDTKSGKKGWCIGNTAYRERDAINGVNIWFQRKNDAMTFIKEFSEYKKPLTYFDYFKDEIKYLNIETGKYMDEINQNHTNLKI